MTKYKLYIVEEDGVTFHEEFYEKSDLLKFKIDEDEDVDLYELASRMISRFNRTLEEGEQKRYAYKLEKVTVRVIGSDIFYGLNISGDMCKPEFK